MNGWIGVDLDGTLAEYHGPQTHIGKPVWPMVALVKKLLDAGKEVRIFTARVGLDGWDSEAEAKRAIRDWLNEIGLPPLAITAAKDTQMIVLYDDRCIQVETNTGRLPAERMADLLARVVQMDETEIRLDDLPAFVELVDEIRRELTAKGA